MSTVEILGRKIDEFKIQQLVAVCGDGKLVDNSACSEQLREVLRGAESEKLFEYVESCLVDGFDKSGQVLQDLVNELGRRLDFEVRNGVYAGRRNKVGFDGIWTASDGYSFVIEVKTTDTYRINLNTIADYRAKLVESQEIGPKSSILIVVGRQDTGELEDQVRGSRHAWDIRLISVDALIKLVRLKENAEENTVAKIPEVLTPFEYTRVDRIIDIAFTAAKEVEEALVKEAGLEIDNKGEESQQKEDKPRTQDRTPSEIIQALRRKIINALAKREGVSLIKRSSALYWSPDKSQVRVACTISKRYFRAEDYWYAYHPSWDEFLSGGVKGYYVLGCVDRDVAYALPFKWIHERLPELYTTKNDERFYWHVALVESDNRDLEFKGKRAGTLYSLTEFAVKLGD